MYIYIYHPVLSKICLKCAFADIQISDISIPHSFPTIFPSSAPIISEAFIKSHFFQLGGYPDIKKCRLISASRHATSTTEHCEHGNQLAIVPEVPE